LQVKVPEKVVGVAATYFARLWRETPTRVWVNNPTEEEIGLALAQGAVGSTTNPAYAGSLLRRAPGEVVPVVDGVLAAHPDADDDEIVCLIQRHLAGRIANRFRPLFDTSAGTLGLVSIQGSPEADTDGERIWAEAQANRAVAVNATPKIPATLPGFLAMERVVEAGWPIIVTEVFSLDQVVAACELYLRVTARTGVRSPFFMSPITGILGDHLKKLAEVQGLDVPQRVMELAGVGLGRRCAGLVAERGYPVTLLFGGARIPEDLIGLAGARHHATINWSTFAEILALDPPIERSIDAPFDPDVERALLELFPDVWKGWQVGRLRPEEFEDFGPVQHFRDNFVVGWSSLRALVKKERLTLTDAGSLA
jgi:transaldolase